MRWIFALSMIKMKVIKVHDNNIQIYLNLVQPYEAEFSSITKKTPNKNGLFDLDTPVDENHLAYIASVNNTPLGIANIGLKGFSVFEVCEFYILPVFRGAKYGTKFIHEIWSANPGTWEIKQITGAKYATEFWRRAITAYRDTKFEENQYRDPYWGNVTRQTFEIKGFRESV